MIREKLKKKKKVDKQQNHCREVRKQRHGCGSASASAGEGAGAVGRAAGDGRVRGAGNPEAEKGCIASVQPRLRVQGQINIRRKKRAT